MISIPHYISVPPTVHATSSFLHLFLHNNCMQAKTLEWPTSTNRAGDMADGTDWLIEWLIDWLTDWFFDWFYIVIVFFSALQQTHRVLAASASAGVTIADTMPKTGSWSAYCTYTSVHQDQDPPKWWT